MTMKRGMSAPMSAIAVTGTPKPMRKYSAHSTAMRANTVTMDPMRTHRRTGRCVGFGA